ncbi:glycosyltransferase [Natrinema sp. 74]|uniref:glycosyltransferase n=1 Tax=Natrinema sp. 74 TaxID=3384159 RepID=UPI0038D46B50
MSVVIPAYNEEPVLPATIEACKNLDYPAETLEGGPLLRIGGAIVATYRRSTSIVRRPFF